MVYANLKIAANSANELKGFFRICSCIQTAGFVGSCVNIPIVVDGGGSGRMQFTLIKDNKEIELPLVDTKDFEYPIRKLWISE